MGSLSEDLGSPGPGHRPQARPGTPKAAATHRSRRRRPPGRTCGRAGDWLAVGWGCATAP